MKLSKAPDHYIDSMIALSQQQPRLKVIQTKNELNARKKPYNRVINRLPYQYEMNNKPQFHRVVVCKDEYSAIVGNKKSYVYFEVGECLAGDYLSIVCGHLKILGAISHVDRISNQTIVSFSVWSVDREGI